MVFQDYALYPHLDVATNIAFPLLARKIDKAVIAEKVEHAAQMLDIEDVLDSATRRSSPVASNGVCRSRARWSGSRLRS